MVPSYRVSAQLAVVLASSLIGFVLGSTDAWRLSGARAPIPNLPQLACINQASIESDGICLTRTEPVAAAKGDALVVQGRSVKLAANWTGTSDARDLPTATEAWRPSAAQSPIPDLPPLPCDQQSWMNADRVCLSWTVPLEVAGAEFLVAPVLSETLGEDSIDVADAWTKTSTDGAGQAGGARGPVPELPPLPCNQQNWTEADRVCLSWTKPLTTAKSEALVVPDLPAQGP